MPKHCDQNFSPSSPSISYLASDRSTDLSLCPIRAYRIYFAVSCTWLPPVAAQDPLRCLWVQPGNPAPLTIRKLTRLFIDVVKDALLEAGLSTAISIGPHQMRKLGASHSKNVGHDENLMKRVMGFSSLNILRKNYIAGVPPLNIACVLPGGPYFPPTGSELSDSDSE